jgi:hypothetical protein
MFQVRQMMEHNKLQMRKENRLLWLADNWLI